MPLPEPNTSLFNIQDEDYSDVIPTAMNHSLGGRYYRTQLATMIMTYCAIVPMGETLYSRAR